MDNNDNDVSAAARRLGAQRRIVEGTCAVCGKPFRGTRKRMYCSHTCAQRAHWAAKKTREGTKP